MIRLIKALIYVLYVLGLVILGLLVRDVFGQSSYNLVLPLVARENVIGATETPERQLFNLVNVYRQENNCDQLVWDDGLAKHASVASTSLSTLNSLNPYDVWWIYNAMAQDGYEWSVASTLLAGGGGVPQASDVDVLWRTDIGAKSILWDCQYTIGGVGYTYDPNSKWKNTWAIIVMFPYDF